MVFIKKVEKMNFRNLEFDEFIDDHGESWFLAEAVCKKLELGDVLKTIAKLDPDEKDVTVLELGAEEGHTTVYYKRVVPLVSEPGLYSLVFQSNTLEAEAFMKWTTEEVIPSITQSKPENINGLLDFFIEFQDGIKKEKDTVM